MRAVVSRKKRDNRSFMWMIFLSFGLTACANTAAIRDAELERYNSLESELISAQQTKQRIARSEYRIAEQPQTLSSEVGKELTSTNDDAIWTVRTYPSPVNGSPICAIVSAPTIVRNGTLDTKATVIVSDEAVYLRTDATFDTNTIETGFQIDAGFPIAFDRFLNELTAVVDEGYKRLTDAMQTGTTLSVAFAYLPQLSSAQTHILELDIGLFGDLWPSLGECERK